VTNSTKFLLISCLLSATLSLTACGGASSGTNSCPDTISCSLGVAIFSNAPPFENCTCGLYGLSLINFITFPNGDPGRQCSCSGRSLESEASEDSLTGFDSFNIRLLTNSHFVPDGSSGYTVLPFGGNSYTFICPQSDSLPHSVSILPTSSLSCQIVYEDYSSALACDTGVDVTKLQSQYTHCLSQDTAACASAPSSDPNC